MKILRSIIAVDRNFLLRFIAVFTFWFGAIAVWGWPVNSDEAMTRFLIRLPSEPSASLPNTEPVFSEEYDSSRQITNVDFGSIDLRTINLSSARITNSDFSGASLADADFTRAKILYANFTGSNLVNSNFSRSMAYCSDFTDANLEGVIFRRANLGHSDFTNARLSGADLTDANLSNARLEAAIGLTYQQVSAAVINEFTTLPPHLEFQRAKFTRDSRKRFDELRQFLSQDDLELFANEFDFID